MRISPHHPQSRRHSLTIPTYTALRKAYGLFATRLTCVAGVGTMIRLVRSYVYAKNSPVQIHPMCWCEAKGLSASDFLMPLPISCLMHSRSVGACMPDSKCPLQSQLLLENPSLSTQGAMAECGPRCPLNRLLQSHDPIYNRMSVVAFNAFPASLSL